MVFRTASLNHTMPRWRVHLGARAACAIIALAAGCVLIYSATQGGGSIFCGVVPFVVTLYCVVTVVLTLCFGRPIRPGWHVAADLILCILLGISDIVLATGFAAAQYLAAHWQEAEMSADGSSLPLGWACADRDGCQAFADGVKQDSYLWLGGLVPQVLAHIILFGLFVRACIDTHRYRHGDTARYRTQPRGRAGAPAGDSSLEAGAEPMLPYPYNTKVPHSATAYQPVPRPQEHGLHF